MKKRTIIWLAITVIAGAAVIIYFTTGKKGRSASLLTGKAEYGYIARTVTATGTVQPVDTVSVGAQVSGVIKMVYADFNSEVKQGQLLAKVDPAIILAQRDQAKASLANVQSNFQYQKSNYERQSKLYDLGAISQADYQLALNQYNSARAAVANASAQLQLSERNLFYTDIYSPINGVVLNRNISAGQTIASSFSAPTLFVIAKDLTHMIVRAAVDEADIGAVRSGQRVTFTVDAFPEDLFEGTVQQVLLHASVSANVVTYTTLIDIDNKQLKLRPGMTASISIYTAEDTSALLIPSKALTFKPDSALLKRYTINKAERMHAAGKVPRPKDGSGRDTASKPATEEAGISRSYVWVKKGDTLTETRILTSMNDDSYVKVVKGLSPGEEVITGVVTNGNIAETNNSQRSPFMPQMRRRTTGGARNP